MTHRPEYVGGVTTHARRGSIKHGFRYNVDFVLIDPESEGPKPLLFSRNRFNVAAVYDRDHGGPLGAGQGPSWARQVLEAHGLGQQGLQLSLLTQPTHLGYVFNPVSFWLVMRGEALLAVIAEVSTPFGDRHSYLCQNPDFAPITADTRITRPKSLHVSPFQTVEGTYEFQFDVCADKINIRILHRNDNEGVVATLSGSRVPLTNTTLIRTSLRRPFGAMRTTVLIYWQALLLKCKGATYRNRPEPPKTEVT